MYLLTWFNLCLYCAVSQVIPIICSEVVICIVFVCFNGGGRAHFWQRTPIPIENGNLSMPENLVMTSAYVLCLSTQTLRVGLKNSVGIEKEVSDICVAVPFEEKLTILWTTKGVARVKIWCEVSWVRLPTKFSENKFLGLYFLLGHPFGHIPGKT